MFVALAVFFFLLTENSHIRNNLIAEACPSLYHIQICFPFSKRVVGYYVKKAG